MTAVRYNGTIHDFMLLDALSETRATRAAIDQATAFLRAGLGTTYHGGVPDRPVIQEGLP